MTLRRMFVRRGLLHGFGAALLLVVWGGRLSALPPDRDISQYVRRSWTVGQGLPHGTVRGFVQTADGYLWGKIARSAGLSDADAETLEHFRQSLIDRLIAPEPSA